MHKTTFNPFKITLIIGLFLFTTLGYSQTYNATTTWTCPFGVTTITVQTWGAGGGGGGNLTVQDGAGAGGGGAYSSAIVNVTPGVTYTVTVGVGGFGAIGGVHASGGTGGDSWFGTTGTILAKGGTGGFPPIASAGGLGGNGGLAASGVGTTKYSGGNGGDGQNHPAGKGGGGGSSAGTAANGNSGTRPYANLNGATAPAGGGNGGDGGTSNSDGDPGVAPGGGGGGAGKNPNGVTATTGGVGANGRIIITYRDYDSDGILDNIDLDDDNDGILDTVEGLIDTDGDGVFNLQDLDSDNDGIADIVEANWTSLSGGKDTMNLVGTWVDANNNGWHDTAEAFYNGGGSVADFDGDGRPNYIDLDSDNDSVFDVDEAGLFNGDGDINCDGVGNGVDTDRDGILDFDALVGFGNTGKAAPTNTLGAGNPDYIKLISQTAGVYDISTTLYASLDGNLDGVIDTPGDVDADGITDTFDTDTGLFGSPRDLDRKLLLGFDGRNDYGEGAAILGGLANASMTAWVNLNSAWAATGYIVGQNMFKMRIDASRELTAIVNGTSVTYTTALTTTQWTHVGVVYDGAAIKLYVNGAMVTSTPLAGSISADATLLTIGRDPSSAANYFNGKIDEVRVFNVALTDEQLQRMVYQEIDNSAVQIKGATVTKDIESLPSANLLRYFKMDAYKDDIIDDFTTPGIDVAGMKIFNHKVIKVQEAPMPFLTERTGDFATAVNSPTKEIRGQDIMDQDWSIVQVSHDITEPSNNTDLGMIVDPGITVTMSNDNKIQNDWYLKLDGKIDLVGKSQLVQTPNSELDVTSAGTIERDQQGQSNYHNYNFWSSPVGGASGAANNQPYTVDGMMKDGTDPNNILDITWTAGYDGSATTPITLSNYWIFKFQNVSVDYANWSAIGESGSLNVGNGYTLKGSDAGSATQNYTFVGKPNNGAISVPIAADYANLSGNPYPSALDATAFINDNLVSTTGTIYFWEHYTTNTTHVLVSYEGGYAARNLVGGTPPVSPPEVSGSGSSVRSPNQYIPVGQGFMVYGSATGGSIVYGNNQRLFIKEDNALSNIMFRQSNSNTLPGMPYDNSDDKISEDVLFKKVRLGFVSENNYHRQLLLGFMDNNATTGIDPGYDAINIDNHPNDMYFVNSDKKLIIQGDTFFNKSSIFPIGVKIATEGSIKFMLDDMENFDTDQKFYIYDNATELYHDINTKPFEINMPVGTVDDRFSLRFQSHEELLATNDFYLDKNIYVLSGNNSDMITIINKTFDTTIQSVQLINMLGQTVKQWDVKNGDEASIPLPVSNLSIGTYIVKIETTKELSVKNSGELNPFYYK